MTAYRATVLRDHTNWSQNTVRLLIGEARPDGAVLMGDGTWKVVEEGTLEPNMGLVLPAGAVEAIGAALQEFQGHASHADTEARILREWLLAERDRVDRHLDRLLDRLDPDPTP